MIEAFCKHLKLKKQLKIQGDLKFGGNVMQGKMYYRNIGNSELKASVVGLGTFAIGGWFWGGVEEKQAISAIQASIDQGVNLIDTAPIYGFGLAEEIVGKAIKGRRDQVIIATKVGLVWDNKEGDFHCYANDQWPTSEPSKYEIYQNLKPSSIQKEIERSLKRLRVDYIDLYQTHWQDSTTPIERTMETLEKLKNEGKIREIGVSNITVDQLKRYGNIASVQEKFSLIDRNIVEKGIVNYCIEHNISILSYFTLEQGLLTGTMSPNRQFKEGDMRKNNQKFTPENRRKINELLHMFNGIAEKYECSITQLMIALTLAQPGITHALIGARDENQAIENAQGGFLSLQNEDIQFMNDQFKKFIKNIY